MSVIVKGRKMPERCGQCSLRCDCKQRMYWEQRPKGCPLVEVTETLFSAENARNFLMENPSKEGSETDA